MGAILLATVMDVGKYFFQIAREFLVIVYENIGDIEMSAKYSRQEGEQQRWNIYQEFTH